MWPNPQFPADLVTFTEEILNGKFHFLCGESCKCNGETITDNQLNHACKENNTDNSNFVFNSQVDDDFSNSAKSNGTGLSVDLDSCNIEAVNI